MDGTGTCQRRSKIDPLSPRKCLRRNSFAASTWAGSETVCGVPPGSPDVRTFAERANNIVRYTEFESGGHFAYVTDPDLVFEDLREFFAGLV